MTPSVHSPPVTRTRPIEINCEIVQHIRCRRPSHVDAIRYRTNLRRATRRAVESRVETKGKISSAASNLKSCAHLPEIPAPVPTLSRDPIRPLNGDGRCRRAHSVGVTRTPTKYEKCLSSFGVHGAVSYRSRTQRLPRFGAGFAKTDRPKCLCGPVAAPLRAWRCDGQDSGTARVFQKQCILTGNIVHALGIATAPVVLS